MDAFRNRTLQPVTTAGVGVKAMLLGFALAVTLLGVGAALAPTVEARTKHAVRGKGTSLVSGVDLPFAIRASGSPGKASGRVAFTLPNLGQLRGTVDCLHVKGNRATLTGQLDQPVAGFTHFALVVQDNGRVRGASADTYWPFIGRQAVGCQTYLEAPRSTLTSGDIRIR